MVEGHGHGGYTRDVEDVKITDDDSNVNPAANSNLKKLTKKYSLELEVGVEGATTFAREDVNGWGSFRKLQVQSGLDDVSGRYCYSKRCDEKK